jgi:hypothetical protein
MSPDESRKPAGIKEVASVPGISIGTVDRALHNRFGVSAKTREKVLKTAERFQYRPNLAARNLKLNRYSKIGSSSLGRLLGVILDAKITDQCSEGAWLLDEIAKKPSLLRHVVSDALLTSHSSTSYRVARLPEGRLSRVVEIDRKASGVERDLYQHGEQPSRDSRPSAKSAASARFALSPLTISRGSSS